MEVVDGGTVVVLLGVSQRLFRVVGEVRHVLLILVVRVVSLSSHRVVVVTVETAMMVRAVIEVLGIVRSINMSVILLVSNMVFIEIRVVVQGSVLGLVHVVLINNFVMDLNMGLVNIVMVSVQVLNVVIVMMSIDVLNDVGNLVDDGLDNLSNLDSIIVIVMMRIRVISVIIALIKGTTVVITMAEVASR